MEAARSMKYVSWLIVLAACGLIAAGLGYFKYAEIQTAVARANAFPEPVEAVEVYHAQTLTRQAQVHVNGEIVAPRSIQLRTELAGRIVRLGYNPGSQVTEGQMLVQLDTSAERAALAEAMAERRLARLALQRADRLVRRGAGSVDARDRARAEAEAAAARVDALNVAIGKKTLTAPFAARTGLQRLDIGQYLDSGTVVTELIGVEDRLWVDFSLPQPQSSLASGDTVEIEVAGANAITATVIAGGPAIDTDSRNRRFRAAIKGSSSVLPGALVSVVVPQGEPENVVVVPQSAVRRDALGTHVYVLIPQSDTENFDTANAFARAQKRPVVVGDTLRDAGGSESTVIRKGLATGERIAANGAFKLYDGARVLAREPDVDATNRAVGH